MIRFKKLLLEENKEGFLQDCSHFIEVNKGKIDNGELLYRGTKNEYSETFTKKAPRKRKWVKGQKIRTYIYEKFKSSELPSRADMIPTQFNHLDEQWQTGEREIVSVFPVGSSYKLVYTDGVRDFNSGNVYLSNLVQHNPKSVINRAKGGYDYDSPEFQKIKKFLNNTGFYSKASHEEVIRMYEKSLNFIENNQDLVDKSSEEIKEELRKLAEAFFTKTHVTERLPLEEGIEVNVYAPNGFYYVNEEGIKKLEEQGIDFLYGDET